MFYKFEEYDHKTRFPFFISQAQKLILYPTTEQRSNSKLCIVFDSISWQEWLEIMPIFFWILYNSPSNPRYAFVSFALLFILIQNNKRKSHFLWKTFIFCWTFHDQITIESPNAINTGFPKWLVVIWRRIIECSIENQTVCFFFDKNQIAMQPF